MTFSPMIIQPFMLMGGFFVNIDTVTWILRWISFISPINYVFKASMLSIFEENDIKCMINGMIIDCDPIKTFGITYSIEEYLLILFFIGLILKSLANIGMYFISNPINQNIKEPIKEGIKDI